MKNILTKEEESVIVRIETARKWDILFHDLGYLVPSAIIIILGTVYGSNSGILIGLLTYSILHLWASVRQCKAMPLCQSAIAKIKEGCRQNNAANGS